MLKLRTDNVRPNFIGDDIYIVLLAQGHESLDLFPLPHPATGIVGRTKDGSMYLFGDDLFLHVGKVHPPHPLGVLHQRGVDNVVAVGGEAFGETNVGRGVDQHLVSLGTEDPQGADHTAQHAVFIADVLRLQSGNTVSPLLPADDGGVVFLRRAEVAVKGVFHPLDNSLWHSGTGSEVHVGHPHRDEVKTLFRAKGGHAASTHAVDGHSIPTLSLDEAGKIVFHHATLLT